jgi:adenylate cyclase
MAGQLKHTRYLVAARAWGYGQRVSPGPADEISVVKRDQLQAGVTSGSMTRAGAISADTVGSEQIFMGISRLPPGLRSSAHIHTNCESALYVASGRGRFLIGPKVDRAVAIEPGDCIHVPPNAPHVVVNDGDVELVLIVARNTQVEQVQEYDSEAQGPPTPAAPTAATRLLPEPLLLDRCKTCRVPIRGPLAFVSRLRGVHPYEKNPQLCNRCEAKIRGAEDTVVTVLFADIRGFTGRTRQSSNEEFLKMMREFFNSAAPVMYEHYGIVDQFLGDGMKVLFNVPAPRVTHAEDAVKAALALQARLRDSSFGVGIGIETGMALAGHIGLTAAVDFTCVGETVNMAARLQALARGGEVVLGPTVHRKTAELLEMRATASSPETVDLKGIGRVEVFRIGSPAEGQIDSAGAIPSPQL